MSKKFESTVHHEERKAKIQEENKQNQAVADELADNQEIANFKGLPKEGETREQLLERIRRLREKPEEVEVELVRSPGLQKEFEAEQKAGREAVAKAEEERKRSEAAWREVEAGEKNQAR